MRARDRWKIASAGAFGLALGLGLFTFGFARGASYLTNDPAACANCHIMTEHFNAWQRGSHHAVATCNDCHTPHDVVGKYTVKALNGFWHSFYFTTGRYPDPLRITPRNRDVTEDACRFCHQQIIDAIDPELARRGARGGPATAMASLVPTSRTAAGASEALQGGTGDGRPMGSGTDAHTDPKLSCIRCHAYVGHLVR